MSSSRLWVLAVLLVFAIPAFAQVPVGSIRGSVKDSSGAIVPGANVTIRNTDTAQTRTVVSGEDGEYLAPSLPVGRYDVTVEHSGFKTSARQGVTLNVGDNLALNFELEIGTAQQEVTVTGEAPLVNTENSTLGGLVNEQQMADLPLNGRNYMDLSLMQPGVTQGPEQWRVSGRQHTVQLQRRTGTVEQFHARWRSDDHADGPRSHV